MNAIRFSRKRWGLFYFGLSLGLIGYFAFQALSGQKSLKARSELKWWVEKQQKQLSDLQKLRAEMERDIALIRRDIDPDLLDEQARRLLNMANKDDLIIMLNRADRGREVSRKGKAGNNQKMMQKAQ